MDKPTIRILTGPDASRLLALGKYRSDQDPMYQRRADGSLQVLVNQNFHVWMDALRGGNISRALELKAKNKDFL